MRALAVATLVALVVLQAMCVYATPLDDYVRKPDSHFEFTDLKETRSGVGWVAHLFNMTSQRWLTDKDSSRPIWWHTVAVIVPGDVVAERDTAILWITGGWNYPGRLPHDDNLDLRIAANMALYSRTAAVVLYQVPNEPITFPADPLHMRRTEGDIIAMTWWHYMHVNASAPEWLLEMPMVKAASKAMDMAEAVVDGIVSRTLKRKAAPIRRFIVSGASKRGWTAWLTAAVESKRVRALVPIVLDALNVREFFKRMYMVYGGWTFTFGDFWKMNITQDIHNPLLLDIAMINDPYFYLPRLTMPKMVINSVGDEFQMPDDQRHWGHSTVGETHFLMVKNTDHMCESNIGEVLQSAGAFMQAVVTETPRPSYTWAYNETDGSLIVETSMPPKVVDVVYGESFEGVSKGKRDFRWAALNLKPCKNFFGGCGRSNWWTTTQQHLERISPTKFRALVPTPPTGWRAFFIEMQFPNPGGPDDFYFSSPASVVPLKYPFAMCRTPQECKGHLV